jgi:thiol-disulfide isomerase/thioredoxin
MKTMVVLTLIGAFLVSPTNSAPTDPPASDGVAASVSWHRDDGTQVWSVPLVPPADRAASPLHAPRFFPKLPPVLAELIDGTRLDFREFKGKVVLIDFWASWCTPCARQLPELQAFYDAEHDNGLDVLTVHADETDDIARRFARARNVTLPIARYSADIRDAFRISGLPTVVVADREGNIRRRFTSGAASTKEQLEEFVRELLEEPADPGPEIAGVLSGEGLLRVRWSRRLKETVLGLAVLHQSDPPERRVVAATGWEIAGFGVDGDQVISRRVGPGVDRLRSAGDSSPIVLFGFRPAGERVVRIPLGGEDDQTWDSPARLLDLYVEPQRFDGPSGLLLATIDGLHRVGLDGSPISSRRDLGLVVDLAGLGAETLLLDGDGELHRLDHELKTLDHWPAPAGSRVLVSVPDLAPGVGLAPVSVLGFAAGRMLGGDGKQLALAYDDQLVLVDLETGLERFRARWPRIAALAADDLDGDGRTELIVGSGKRVTVLTSR